MSKDQDNLPVQTEKPSLADYLDSLLPFRIPRLPFVRTAANLDKAAARLILAKAEQRAARVDAVTAKIKHQSNVEGRFLEASERVAENTLNQDETSRDAAFAYLEAETTIKFTNRTKVLEQATNELTSTPPQLDSDDEIDDDWLNTFARMAEEKSSAELQNLFGKILAGEIRKPGSYSLRTLQFVSCLVKSEAEQIVEFLKFVVDKTFVPRTEDVRSFLPLDMIIKMDNLGIIKGDIGTFGGLTWSKTIPPNEIMAYTTATNVCIEAVNIGDKELKIEINCNVLSDVGKEILSLASVTTTPKEYIDWLGKFILSKAKAADGIASIEVYVSQIISATATQFYRRRLYKLSPD
jgi:hypothetical protein